MREILHLGAGPRLLYDIGHGKSKTKTVDGRLSFDLLTLVHVHPATTTGWRNHLPPGAPEIEA